MRTLTDLYRAVEISEHGDEDGAGYPGGCRRQLSTVVTAAALPPDVATHDARL